MKAFLLYFAAVVCLLLLASCSLYEYSNSQVLKKFKLEAKSYELIYSDLIWDGGSTVEGIAYKGGFKGERYIYVWNRFYRDSPFRRVFVTETENWEEANPEEIINQDDKMYLIEILDGMKREYPQLISTILVLKGEPELKKNTEYKMPIRMQKRMEDIVRKNTKNKGLK